MLRVILVLVASAAVWMEPVLAQDSPVTGVDKIPAAAKQYGEGCGGKQSADPRLDVSDVPRLGSTDFAMIVTGVAPAAPMHFVYSLRDAYLPFGNCAILIDLGLVAADFAWMSDSSGTAKVPQPIPNLPAWAGIELFVQVVALDVEGGEFLGSLVLTNGILIQLGY